MIGFRRGLILRWFTELYLVFFLSRGLALSFVLKKKERRRYLGNPLFSFHWTLSATECDAIKKGTYSVEAKKNIYLYTHTHRRRKIKRGVFSFIFSWGVKGSAQVIRYAAPFLRRSWKRSKNWTKKGKPGTYQVKRKRPTNDVFPMGPRFLIVFFCLMIAESSLIGFAKDRKAEPSKRKWKGPPAFDVFRYGRGCTVFRVPSFRWEKLFFFNSFRLLWGHSIRWPLHFLHGRAIFKTFFFSRVGGAFFF